MNPTELPAEYLAWFRAVSRLAAAILAYLTPAKTVRRHVREGESPIKEEVNPEYLHAAVEECRRAAEIVGTERKRISVSKTLSRAERDAMKLAGEVVVPIPEQRMTGYRQVCGWSAARNIGRCDRSAQISPQISGGRLA